MQEYLKSNWTEQFKQDYEQLPAKIKDLAGDLFELKWYAHADREDLTWELEHNLIGTKKGAEEFMQEYDKLTKHQLSLIYWAYEA